MVAFLDKLGNMQYVIFIAISNKPIEWFEKDDNVYIIRNGRFTFKRTLTALSPDELVSCFESGCNVFGVK
jgi:hypothetical protein